MDSDKKKALELALGKIEKDFGKGSLMRLGDKPDEKIPVIPTGALSLDIALGIGGVPRGRIIEISIKIDIDFTFINSIFQQTVDSK